MNEDYNGMEQKENEYGYSSMQEPPYHQDNRYSQPNMFNEETDPSNGFGIASLICGIISIISCCCCCSWVIGLPCGIAAVVLGILQIVKYQKRGMAIGGIITGSIGLLMSILMAICTILLVNTGVYQEMMDEILEEYRMMMEYSEQDEYVDVLAQHPAKEVLCSCKVPFKEGD